MVHHSFPVKEARPSRNVATMVVIILVLSGITFGLGYQT